MGNRAGHWADRVAELCGTAALACGLGGSAWLVAPLTGVAPAMLAVGAAAIGGLAGLAIVRAAPGADARRPLPEFEIVALADVVIDEPELAEILLDEQDPATEPSRVVQLFDPPEAETPGALQARIEAHLGDPSSTAVPTHDESPAPWNGSPAIPDASDALHAALADIRRTLRAG